MPKMSEDTILAHSPSLSMGLLISDNGMSNESYPQQQQQLSPFTRSLSQVVAPFIFDDETAKIYENHHYEQCSKNFCADYWQEKVIEDSYMKYHFEQELASIDALIDEY